MEMVIASLQNSDQDGTLRGGRPDAKCLGGATADFAPTCGRYAAKHHSLLRLGQPGLEHAVEGLFSHFRFVILIFQRGMARGWVIQAAGS